MSINNCNNNSLYLDGSHSTCNIVAKKLCIYLAYYTRSSKYIHYLADTVVEGTHQQRIPRLIKTYLKHLPIMFLLKKKLFKKSFLKHIIVIL